ncbi:hypothetical protein C8D86_12020 [Aquicella lusitana]|uniref:UPF0235 protein C8D86_12020 n=1 Tax=Aquicella lusitana TaxID=254246 RepID=A0A370GDL6_9COXI|nr:hypothetical protein C8D86_12020 [Aquicella lusitana]
MLRLAKPEAPWYYWRDSALYLHIYLQPRASKNEITGVHEDCLKVRLTAPPIEGRANLALLKYLAHCFKVAERQVTLVKGEQSRKKWIRIDSPRDLSLINT